MSRISLDNKQGLFYQHALREILCCPLCKGELKINNLSQLECTICRDKYLIKENIFILMTNNSHSEQSEEQIMREKIAQPYADKSSEEILRIESRHHSIPVMSERAEVFRAKFNPSEWVLDAGCGSGYYWRNSQGAKLILIDFAFSNLKSAKTMLKGQDNVIFIQSDATCMPIRYSSVSGIWSIQVTQHLPHRVMSLFMGEVRQILKSRFLIEIYNLNPAIAHRFLYRLFGKEFHIKNESSGMVLNRLNARELSSIWGGINKYSKLKVNYSELFFHPDLHLYFQNKYTSTIENLLTKVPWLVVLFARQIQISISSCRKV